MKFKVINESKKSGYYVLGYHNGDHYVFWIDTSKYFDSEDECYTSDLHASNIATFKSYDQAHAHIEDADRRYIKSTGYNNYRLSIEPYNNGYVIVGKYDNLTHYFTDEEWVTSPDQVANDWIMDFKTAKEEKELMKKYGCPVSNVTIFKVMYVDTKGNLHDDHDINESLKEKFNTTSDFPYMFFYNCNNPTFGYDFQLFAGSLGARKVYGKYQGNGAGSYFYLVPSEEVYNKLKDVAKDKYTVEMQKLLPYDAESYPNVQYIKESFSRDFESRDLYDTGELLSSLKELIKQYGHMELEKEVYLETVENDHGRQLKIGFNVAEKNKQFKESKELNEGLSEKQIADILNDAKYNSDDSQSEYYWIGYSAAAFLVKECELFLLLPDHISEEDIEYKDMIRGYKDNNGMTIFHESIDKIASYQRKINKASSWEELQEISDEIKKDSMLTADEEYNLRFDVAEKNRQFNESLNESAEFNFNNAASSGNWSYKMSIQTYADIRDEIAQIIDNLDQSSVFAIARDANKLGLAIDKERLYYSPDATIETSISPEKINQFRSIVMGYSDESLNEAKGLKEDEFDDYDDDFEDDEFEKSFMNSPSVKLHESLFRGTEG